METETRLLATIAADIRRSWVDKKGKPNVYFGAVPYLEAMAQLGRMDDTYGADSAEYIVLYFLANANTFRGEKAREIKAELRRMAGLK